MSTIVFDMADVVDGYIDQLNSPHQVELTKHQLADILSEIGLPFDEKQGIFEADIVPNALNAMQMAYMSLLCSPHAFSNELEDKIFNLLQLLHKADEFGVAVSWS